MSQEPIQPNFDHIYRKFVNLATLSNEERPIFLAHYTSLESLEKIIQNNELCFSNPLFMNDHQEMRYGLTEGRSIIRNLAHDESIHKSLKGIDNFKKIIESFDVNFRHFDDEHSLDVYAFCLSEYDMQSQPHGRLSMWRGYGANGQGAALVFNTSAFNLVPGSPLLIGKVDYADEADRSSWLKSAFIECLDSLQDFELSDQNLFNAGFHIFQISLLYGLFSKHPGFREEQEWRIVYLPHLDKQKLMQSARTYVLRDNKVAPKLKFPIQPLDLEPRQNWTFESILERIVLGPTHASPLAFHSAKRMLESLGKPEFAAKLWVSQIPYRPI